MLGPLCLFGFIESCPSLIRLVETRVQAQDDLRAPCVLICARDVSSGQDVHQDSKTSYYILWSMYFSYGFPMVFLWSSYGVPWKPPLNHYIFSNISGRASGFIQAILNDRLGRCSKKPKSWPGPQGLGGGSDLVGADPPDLVIVMLRYVKIC